MWLSIILLALAAGLSWYAVCAERYIQWLEQTLKYNNIEIPEDRYGYERK